MESKEEPLIDLLYKDTYRVDSFIAQILKGTPRDLKMQESDMESTTSFIEGNIRIAKGYSSGLNQHGTVSEYNLDPHDHSTLDLLDALDLHLLYDVPVDAVGRLVHLAGTLSIRNFETANKLITAIKGNASLFGINKADASQTAKMMNAIKEIVPLNIECELAMHHDCIVRGILKEAYMLTAYRDIVAMHGTTLPGVWHIVGIFDSPRPQATHMSGQLRNGLDALAQTAHILYNSNFAPRYNLSIPIISRLPPNKNGINRVHLVQLNYTPNSTNGGLMP